MLRFARATVIFPSLQPTTKSKAAVRSCKRFIDVVVHVASARAPDPPEVMSERRLSGAKTIQQTSDHAGEVIAEFMCTMFISQKPYCFHAPRLRKATCCSVCSCLVSVSHAMDPASCVLFCLLTLPGSQSHVDEGYALHCSSMASSLIPGCSRCVLSSDQVSMGRGCRHRLDFRPFRHGVACCHVDQDLTNTMKHTRTSGAEKTPAQSVGVTNFAVCAYVQRQHRQLDGVRCGRLHARM